jgi:SAM-dependent methyltransferase
MSTQAEYWNADAGPSWVDAQVQLDAELGPCGALALAAADLRAGEAVLDVGCGCGGTTAELARAVGEGGRVMGVDISAPMLARARERIAARNAELVLADAATAPLPPSRFDVLFSRFGVMFFDDPVGAFAHLRGALKADGRVAMVVWRRLEENPWVTVPNAAIAGLVEPVPLGGDGEPGPFALADGERLQRILRDAGYADVVLTAEALDLLIGGGLHAQEAGAFSIDHGPLRRALASAPDGVRAAAAERITAALEPYDSSDGVRLGAAMWVVTARAG